MRIPFAWQPSVVDPACFINEPRRGQSAAGLK
jgi:hypothetical protein